MKRFITLLLTIFVAASAVYAEIRLHDYYRNMPQSFTIPSFKQGGYIYIDAEGLAAVLNIQTYREPAKRKLVYFLPENKFKITADNHFIVIDDDAFQMTVPALEEDGALYLPLEPFLQQFGNLLPGALVYFQGELTYSMRKYNVLRVASTYNGMGITLDILTSEPLGFTTEETPEGKLILSIIGGSVEQRFFQGNALPQGVDSLQVVQYNEYSKLIFKFASSAKVDTIFANDNPMSIRIALSGSTSNPSVIQDTLINRVREQWRIDTIVIDPGHGGKDPGAVGPTGLYEKDVVLDIALRMEKLLKSKTDIKVVLTRRTDIFIPLYERGKIANQNGGKLFVSIHCNASKNRKAKGCQVFFLSPARNEQALEVVMLENAVIEFEEDQTLYQDLTDENYILLAMTQSAYVHESEQLCGFIKDRFSQQTNLNNRGVSQAGFYVLYGANMPAVLVETAFISNPYEEKLLKGKKFRQTMAEVIYNSIIKFCQEKEKEI